MNSDLRTTLEQIIEIHGMIRNVYPDTSPEGHFINENTVLRVASLLELYDFKPSRTLNDDCAAANEYDVCVRALFFIRDTVMHSGGNASKLYKKDKNERLKILNEFYRRHNLPTITLDDRPYLGGKEALTPLINGCIEYVRRKSSTR
jgi:hypothetical protein